MCDPIFIDNSLDSEALLNVVLDWGKQWVIISDHNVAALFGAQLEHFLRSKSCLVHLLSFVPGEGSKCQKVKSSLEDSMFQMGCNRDWGIIALGGGVVTDLAGYIAATFCSVSGMVSPSLVVVCCFHQRDIFLLGKFRVVCQDVSMTCCRCHVYFLAAIAMSWCAFAVCNHLVAFRNFAVMM